MLSTRTKQVNAYGKRGKRVVDVSVSDAKPLPREIVSIFGDLPPPPAWAPVVSRMKGRENAMSKQKAPVQRVVRMQRKKRLSPVLSPIKKPVRVAQPINESKNPSSSGGEHALQQFKPKVKQLALGEKANSAEIFDSPRAPFSPFSINAPGSPLMLPRTRTRAMKPCAPPTSKLCKSAPDIKLDIIVLDNEGRTISKELRVSRTRAETKPTNVPHARPTRKSAQSNARLPIYVYSESEPKQPKPEKWLKKRATRVIFSDDSASDDEAPPSPAIAVKDVARKKPTGSKPLERTATIEVIIPPAPYSLKQVPRLATLPNIIQPGTPPKPRANVMPTRAPIFKLPTSPIFKGRQLTPIRGGRTRGLFEQHSPPSPCITDLDLSIDFSDLSLYSGEISGSAFVEQTIPEYLKPILAECHQEDCGPHDFSSFIELFPFDPILQSAREKGGGDLIFKKIGEASYSEVFGIGNVVLKVIPLRDESPKSAAVKQHTLKLASRGTPDDHDMGDDVPPPSDAQDVRKEIIVTRAMGEVHHGFVKLLKTYVVKGKYPETLLNLWDDYNDHKGSESIRPAAFGLSQVYVIIVLPNGGPDLEAYRFSSPLKSGWRQAASIFWQVAKSLAHAEHLVSFEHRDLHWGQILVNNVSQKAKLKAINMNSGLKARSHKRAVMDDLDHGVQVTVIDLGLSRMDAGDGSDGNRVQWTPFDEEIFMGEGDYQFDVYRMMRDLTGGDWEGFHPKTNIMWLHYLATKLLRSKGLKPPGVTRKAKSAEAPTDVSGFSEKECYECLVELEQWLGQTLGTDSPDQAKARAPSAAAKSKGKRPTVAHVPISRHEGLAFAGEVVEYGAKRGWIRASSLL